MRKRINREEGFTLIELMVVVLIIGILVAIAVPVYFSAQTNAKEKTCKANLRTLDGALQTYAAETGDYPAAGVYATVLAVLVPNYLKELPACPGTGTYTYNNVAGSAANVTCSIAGHNY